METRIEQQNRTDVQYRFLPIWESTHMSCIVRYRKDFFWSDIIFSDIRLKHQMPMLDIDDIFFKVFAHLC
jgi:hypothetical protein